MNLENIKNKLKENSIFLSEEKLIGSPTVIGYEKKFRWLWIATQLNTFIVVSDLGDTEITVEIIEKHLTEAFKYAEQNYTGWPRGLQSGIGVISILISSNVTIESKDYCKLLKSGKKWAGFSIPVIIDSYRNSTYYFERKPIWGAIYFPYFKKIIEKFT